jgi:hypothetical protein
MREAAPSKPSPAWRERVASGTSRGRVGAPDEPSLLGRAGAFTLTRLTLFGTLSRQAGEGF